MIESCILDHYETQNKPNIRSAVTYYHGQFLWYIPERKEWQRGL
jgi:hypothetical protein